MTFFGVCDVSLVVWQVVMVTVLVTDNLVVLCYTFSWLCKQLCKYVWAYVFIITVHACLNTVVLLNIGMCYDVARLLYMFLIFHKTLFNMGCCYGLTPEKD